MTANVGMPDERYMQLHHLADKEGKSLVDLIADFINGAIDAGRMPAGLPGWTVEQRGGNVFFADPEKIVEREWTPAVASAVADNLEQLATPAGRMKAVLDLDANLQLERAGPAVRMIDVDTGAKRVVSRSIARDLAGLIRKAA